MHIKSNYRTALLRFPKEPYNLAGFEHGSLVPQVDAMTTAVTAPRRQRAVF
jgi:hypothetical protein